MMNPISNRNNETGKASIQFEHQFLDYENKDFSKTNVVRVNKLQRNLLSLLDRNEYSYFFLAEKLVLSLERKHKREEDFRKTWEYDFCSTIVRYMEKSAPIKERFLFLDNCECMNCRMYIS